MAGISRGGNHDRILTGRLSKALVAKSKGPEVERRVLGVRDSVRGQEKESKTYKRKKKE